MESNLKRLLKNYSNARRSWEAWCFMVNFEVKTPRFDIARHMRNDNFLSHYLYLSMKNFYIEMYKIVKASNKNQDNIFRLLDIVIATNSEKSGQAQRSLSELNEIDPIIKTMCDLRDKFYAHLDHDYEKYIYKGVSIEDYRKCFFAVERAIIALSSVETLQSCLNEIPSRNDFKFELH